jgi:translation initiation factor 1
MSDNDWKKRLGVVYSTSDNFDYEHQNDEPDETLPPEEQNLKVFLDKKQRKGKKVSLVSGFIGNEDDLKDLAKMIKTKCGVGGSAKEGEILIQGDFRDKIVEILSKEGYNVKKAGG